jgi:hypothetical protein
MDPGGAYDTGQVQSVLTKKKTTSAHATYATKPSPLATKRWERNTVTSLAVCIFSNGLAVICRSLCRRTLFTAKHHLPIPCPPLFEAVLQTVHASKAGAKQVDSWSFTRV